MAITLAHLSDIHIKESSDSFFDRVPAIADAIAGSLSVTTEAIILAFTGDMAFGGQPAQYDLFAKAVEKLENRIHSRASGIAIIRLMIPGNHDCDFSGDQSARNHLVTTLEDAEPTTSIADVVLKAQHPYLAFAQSFAPELSITADSPYFTSKDVSVGARTYRFVLVNSAWSSILKEQQGHLAYPVSAIRFPSGSPDIVIAAVHHPFHWFKQPHVMRQLRDRVAAGSDIVLTGHEHVAAAFVKNEYVSHTNQYFEAGVLQDSDDASTSCFGIIHIDLELDSQAAFEYRWEPARQMYTPRGIYAGKVFRNSDRSDIRFRIATKFEAWLEDPELPVTTAGSTTLRLSDFFIYPDLREANRSDPTGAWKRIKGGESYSRIAKEHKVLITGAEKSGKTSLAKRLFADFHRNGFVPVLFNADTIAGSLRKHESVVKKALRQQYERDVTEEFAQLPPEKKVIIVDDLEKCLRDQSGRVTLLRQLAFASKHVILIGGDEYCLEEIHQRDRIADDIWEYTRLDICEFGQL